MIQELTVMGSSSSSPAVSANTNMMPPVECPAHNKGSHPVQQLTSSPSSNECPVKTKSECPVQQNATQQFVSECPATINIQQANAPDEINLANMVRFYIFYFVVLIVVFQKHSCAITLSCSVKIYFLSI